MSSIQKSQSHSCKSMVPLKATTIKLSGEQQLTQACKSQKNTQWKLKSVSLNRWQQWQEDFQICSLGQQAVAAQQEAFWARSGSKAGRLARTACIRCKIIANQMGCVTSEKECIQVDSSWSNKYVDHKYLESSLFNSPNELVVTLPFDADHKDPLLLEISLEFDRLTRELQLVRDRVLGQLQGPDSLKVRRLSQKQNTLFYSKKQLNSYLNHLKLLAPSLSALFHRLQEMPFRNKSDAPSYLLQPQTLALDFRPHCCTGIKNSLFIGGEDNLLCYDIKEGKVNKLSDQYWPTAMSMNNEGELVFACSNHSCFFVKKGEEITKCSSQKMFDGCYGMQCVQNRLIYSSYLQDKVFWSSQQGRQEIQLGNLNRPWGVLVVENVGILVCDSLNRRIVLNRPNNQIKYISYADEMIPRALALSPRHFLITDQNIGLVLLDREELRPVDVQERRVRLKESEGVSVVGETVWVCNWSERELKGVMKCEQ